MNTRTSELKAIKSKNNKTAPTTASPVKSKRPKDTPEANKNSAAQKMRKSKDVAARKNESITSNERKPGKELKTKIITKPNRKLRSIDSTIDHSHRM